MFPELTNKREENFSLENYIIWLTEVAVRVRFPIREFDVCFSTPCRAVLRPTEPLVQWSQEILSEDINVHVVQGLKLRRCFALCTIPPMLILFKSPSEIFIKRTY